MASPTRSINTSNNTNSNNNTNNNFAAPNNVKQLDIGSWLELTDIKHRYGKSLMKYYRYWLMYEKEEED